MDGDDLATPLGTKSEDARREENGVGQRCRRGNVKALNVEVGAALLFLGGDPHAMDLRQEAI